MSEYRVHEVIGKLNLNHEVDDFEEGLMVTHHTLCDHDLIEVLVLCFIHGWTSTDNGLCDKCMDNELMEMVDQLTGIITTPLVEKNDYEF